MLDPIIFADKLRQHRKKLGLTQEEVAARVGVTAQAISKWEAADCLPDLYNLEALSRVLGLSPDILLNTDSQSDVHAVADRIEQIATEFIWQQSQEHHDQPYIHHDLGEDLLTLWKGIYFVEAGNREMQKKDKEQGNMRISSPHAMKVWDDDGIVCVVKASLMADIGSIGEREYTLLGALASPEGMAIISLCRQDKVISKEALIEQSGIPLARLNDLLLLFSEHLILSHDVGGYRLCGHYAIAACMVLAAGYLLGKKKYTVSEYIGS